MRSDDRSEPFRHDPDRATWFVTAGLAKAGDRLLVDHVDLLRGAVRHARALKGFEIVSWVTLPDHFHALLALNPADRDLGTIVGCLKARFTRDLPRSQGLPSDGQSPWAASYLSRPVPTPSEIRSLVSYCNLNPVRHGLVRDPFDWPYSSIHRDMRAALADGATRANRLVPGTRRIIGPDGAPRRAQDASKTGEIQPKKPAPALSPKARKG